MPNNIEIFTDGSCLGNPGVGGWAAIVHCNDEERIFKGSDLATTNNRMEIKAVIEGIKATPVQSDITLYSDSQYVIGTMTKHWNRKANLDLWQELDSLISQRKVTWQWVRGHDGNPDNERADRIAVDMARELLNLGGVELVDNNEEDAGLSHVDVHGNATMVDVGWKDATSREAEARGCVFINKETLSLIKKGDMKKGDVLSVARISGIMAAKNTSNLIPLCHPLPIDQVAISLDLDEMNNKVDISATVRTFAKTGVEMEALTAVSVAALTVYDMCKSVDMNITIENIRLVRKQGGKRGSIAFE